MNYQSNVQFTIRVLFREYSALQRTGILIMSDAMSTGLVPQPATRRRYHTPCIFLKQGMAHLSSTLGDIRMHLMEIQYYNISSL